MKVAISRPSKETAEMVKFFLWMKEKEEDVLAQACHDAEMSASDAGGKRERERE